MATNTGKKARKAAVARNSNWSNDFKPVIPLNYIQEEYLEAIRRNDIIFGIGSAGTGKTYIPAHFAAEQLFYKRINKIILTRPVVEANSGAGKGVGYLPGTLEEKYAPYLEPFDSVFSKTLGEGFYKYCLDNKYIEPKPIDFMRGATFEHCMVLVDEVQNMTSSQFKLLLSRIGDNCKIVLSGDPKQVDIKNSGLEDAVKRTSRIQGIEVVNFLESDIVRSRLCKEIILAYNN